MLQEEVNVIREKGAYNHLRVVVVVPGGPEITHQKRSANLGDADTYVRSAL